MTETFEEKVRRLMAENCMTPAQSEEAKQRLQALFDAHPEMASDFERWTAAQDAWNFPKRRP